MNLSRLTVLALLVCLTACAPKGVDVRTKFGPDNDFSKYKTWNWVPMDQWRTGDARIDDPTVKDTIERAIRDEMYDAGFERVEENPDMIINYTVGISREMDDDAFNDKTDQWAPKNNFEKGALTILIFETETGGALFGGVAEAEVDNSATRASKEKRLRGAVSEIFNAMKKGMK
jgi:hypothetical protein